MPRRLAVDHPEKSYKREYQEKNLPIGSVPKLFSRHSALMIEGALSIREWSSPDLMSVSSDVVLFHYGDGAIGFLKATSLTVIHSMSGNAWSYLRLAAYGFVGLSEEA